MRRDDDGPYVRYLDHVEELARIEASKVHQRAVMSTIPLDTAAERLRVENARLRSEVAMLHAQLGAHGGATPEPDTALPSSNSRVRG